MSNEAGDGDRQRSGRSARSPYSYTLIFNLLAAIFFLLITLLIVLCTILVYRFIEDGARLRAFLEHYASNSLSVTIVLLNWLCLGVAFLLICFSIYLLRFRSNSGRTHHRTETVPLRKEQNSFFSEITNTSTRTIREEDANLLSSSSPCSSSSSSSRTKSPPPPPLAKSKPNAKSPRKCMVEKIHVERSITFH